LRERVRVRGIQNAGARSQSIAIGNCLGKEKKSYGCHAERREASRISSITKTRSFGSASG
jgi:hypothetical protein